MPSTQTQSVGEKLLALPLGGEAKSFLDYMTVEAGLSNNTIMAYGRDLKSFLEYSRASKIRSMDQIQPALIQSYLRELDKRQKDESSIKRGLVAIRMFLRYGKLTGLIEDDFATILEGPKVWQKLPVICSKRQMEDLLNAPSVKEAYYLRDRAILELLYATGLRASELAGLKISDLNLDIGYLRCIGKGSRERVVPVGKIALLIVALLVTPLQARIITVDNDGSANFDNIQAAINDANQGDEIIVDSGRYEENIRIDKDIILISTNQNDPEVVADTRIVNATLSDSTIYFSGNESPACILSGFTITGDGQWNTVEFGGGINGNGTLATIEHNVITENELRHQGFPYATIGGGLFDCDGTIRYNIISENQIYCDLEGIAQGAGLCGCDGDIYQNIISNNLCVGFDFTFGGGLSNCNGTISNNTIFANDAQFGAGISLCLGTIRNCIIWGDTSSQIYASPTVTYCNVQGGYIGTGNLNVDPCFADPTNDDFHLKSSAGRWDADTQTWVLDVNTSLCIDAGNPGCPVGDEPDPNGNRINMGAYASTPQASKSPFMHSFLVDPTNDRKVDANDLRILADHWLDSGPCIPADFDRSQTVNATDFAILANSWKHHAGMEAIIDYTVAECSSGATASEAGSTRFSVSAQGNYIHFEDIIVANCCVDEIELQMTVDGNAITIREIEHVTTPCHCICDFPTTANLGPFEDGTYIVEILDIYGSSLGTAQVTIGSDDQPHMDYSIGTCTDQAAAASVTTLSEETRFTVTVEGQHLHFEDMMLANCCPDELRIEMTIEGTLITIREVEQTTEPCRCTCDFPVAATIGPLEPATYTIDVYQNELFIGTETVTIEPGQ